MERAVFGGGCFWCIEAVFRELRGVSKVTSGYAGGKSKNPTYEKVCSGKSGHAEVVAIDFDPKKISFSQLLDVFWEAHDPTTRDRQGADMGTQYRSVIFYTSEAQRQVAQESMEQQRSLYSQRRVLGCIPMPAPVVTELSPLPQFFPAEKYHQRYFEKTPYVPYCAVNIVPKVAKIRARFVGLLRDKDFEDD